MHKKRKSEDGSFNIWRSYSDMMCGVLLLFVLIMCVTLFQAQKSYDESIKEQQEKNEMQANYIAEITAQQNTLDDQDAKLKTQDEKLSALAQQLAEQTDSEVVQVIGTRFVLYRKNKKDPKIIL